MPEKAELPKGWCLRKGSACKHADACKGMPVKADPAKVLLARGI